MEGSQFFSMVGLIPGALSGCNIENFKIGAKSILKKIFKKIIQKILTIIFFPRLPLHH